MKYVLRDGRRRDRNGHAPRVAEDRGGKNDWKRCRGSERRETEGDGQCRARLTGLPLFRRGTAGIRLCLGDAVSGMRRVRIRLVHRTGRVFNAAGHAIRRRGCPSGTEADVAGREDKHQQHRRETPAEHHHISRMREPSDRVNPILRRAMTRLRRMRLLKHDPRRRRRRRRWHTRAPRPAPPVPAFPRRPSTIGRSRSMRATRRRRTCR
jgi:hypothetical protein